MYMYTINTYMYMFTSNNYICITYLCFFRVSDNLLSAQVLDKLASTLKNDNGTQILIIFSNLSDKLFSHQNKARSHCSAPLIRSLADPLL